MVFISIILTSKSLDENSIEIIKSIANQTFTDYEVLCFRDYYELICNSIDNTSIKDKIIVVESNKLNDAVRLAQGKYIIFLNKGYKLHSKDSLKSAQNVLNKKNVDFIQANLENKSHKKSNDKLLSIEKLFNSSVYNRDFVTENININPENLFAQLSFATEVMLNLEDYLIVDDILVETYNKEVLKFNNAEEIISYTGCIRKTLEKLKNHKNRTLLYDLSEHLPEIDYDNIPKISEDKLKLIKDMFLEIRSCVSDCDIQLISYNILKYFRTFYDMIYNSNMSFDTLISIIIPTYNVEKYIDDCLTSLLEQSLDNIEIICVDDCSTDKTVDILKSYEEIDSRVKCYVRNEKSGSGGCRNFGLTKARGKYVQYVDSDDFLDLNTLEKLYDLAERYKTQIIMFKATCYIHNENKFEFHQYYEMENINRYRNKLLGINDYVKSHVFQTAVVPWNKLYLRSFLIDMDIKFPENIIHQDNPFFYESFINADRIYFIEDHLYNRRKRSNSITTLCDETELGVVDIIELILKVFIKYGVYEKYKAELLNRLFAKFNYRYYVVKEEYREEYYNLVKLKIEKFNNYYGLYDDLNSLLNAKNHKLFKTYMTTKNYAEFSKLYK